MDNSFISVLLPVIMPTNASQQNTYHNRITNTSKLWLPTWSVATIDHSVDGDNELGIKSLPQSKSPRLECWKQILSDIHIYLTLGLRIALVFVCQPQNVAVQRNGILFKLRDKKLTTTLSICKQAKQARFSFVALETFVKVYVKEHT